MLKTWREAASLILTAHKPRPAVNTIKQATATSKTPSQNELIEEETSTPEWNKIFDYQVLMLKRSSRSKFMPNAYVFPGGVSSPIDFNKEWKEYFSSHGFQDSHLQSLVLEGKDRPFLLQRNESDSNDHISRDMAFRLAAIRETFEESGILLYHDPNNKDSKTSTAHTFNCDNKELEAIRKKVHADPNEILKLYKELELVPDLWNLSEWSDWLTPVDLHEQGARRFDTIFYTASLSEVPHTILEDQEISAVCWTDPGSILNQFYRRKLWLAPPQVYELCRLLNFEDLDQLQEFAAARQEHGCVNWLPVRLQCDDGLLSLLPGDSMYPENPDYIGKKDKEDKHEKKQLNVFKGSIEESLQSSSHHNRLTFKDTYHCIPKVNIPPANGHVNPLQYHPFQMQKFLFPVEKYECAECDEKQIKFCQSQKDKMQCNINFNEQELKKNRNKDHSYLGKEEKL